MAECKPFTGGVLGSHARPSLVQKSSLPLPGLGSPFSLGPRPPPAAPPPHLNCLALGGTPTPASGPVFTAAAAVLSFSRSFPSSPPLKALLHQLIHSAHARAHTRVHASTQGSPRFGSHSEAVPSTFPNSGCRAAAGWLWEGHTPSLPVSPVPTGSPFLREQHPEQSTGQELRTDHFPDRIHPVGGTSIASISYMSNWGPEEDRALPKDSQQQVAGPGFSSWPNSENGMYSTMSWLTWTFP